MKIIIYSFMFLILIISDTKPQVFEWAEKFGGSGEDKSLCSTADSYGNIYTVGFFQGTADFDPGPAVFNLTSEGSFDIFVTKLDPDGNFLWAKRFGSTASDEGYSIEVDDFSNVYFTGTFRNTVDFDPGPSVFNLIASGRDIAVCKLNTNGEFIWAKRIGRQAIYTNGSSQVNSIQLDEQRNIYLTGSFDLSVDFDPSDQVFELTPVGANDIFLCKLSSGGEFVWAVRMGGNFQDYGNSLSVNQDQDIVITGSISGPGSSDFGSINLTPQANDIFVCKVNKDGNFIWAKQFTGASGGYGYGIDSDNNNNILITGKFIGTFDFDPGLGIYSLTSGNSDDIFITKLDPFGNFIWAKSMGSNNYDQGLSVSTDSKNNIFATGSFMGTVDFDPGSGVFNLTSAGGSDIFVTNLDSSGNFISAFSFGNTDPDVGTSIKIRNDDSRILAGYFRNTVDFNPGSEVYPLSSTGGISDAFVTIYSNPIISPELNSKYLAMDTLKITWRSHFDSLFIDISVDADNYTTDPIAQSISGLQREFLWVVPQNIVDYKSNLKISDASNQQLLFQSQPFRIKDYVFTKTTGDSLYVVYKFGGVNSGGDIFQFINIASQVWPASHFNQFNYQGIDPYTGFQYDQLIADSVFMKATSNQVPDWPSFVRVFGVNAIYRDQQNGIYNKKGVIQWRRDSTPFRGICFGFVIANANYFMNKEAFLTKYPNFPDSSSARNIVVNDDVINVLVELYEHQRGNPHKAYDDANNNKSPNQTVSELLEMFSKDDVEPRGLIMRNNNGGGGHIVNPYSILKSGENWTINIYDNNFSTPQVVTVYPDSGNGNGSWTYPGLSGWGGTSKLFLKDPIPPYLFTTPTLPKIGEIESPFAVSDTLMIISNSYSSDIKIVDNLGRISGYQNEMISENIPNSFADIIDTGTETPPIGFILPADSYGLELSNFTTERPTVYFENGEMTYVYERVDATDLQTDLLSFDGSLSLKNTENVAKNSTLISLLSNPVEDKMFIVKSLNLTQNDSININYDSDRLNLTNYGISKSYNIGLEYAALGRNEIFNHSSVQLASNSKHIISPDWSNIFVNELKIFVDLGNDGTIDDTVKIQNQFTDVKEHGSLQPNEFRLEQNYPNPFNPNTKIKYTIPNVSLSGVEGSRVQLKVYDVLGNEVATLVNESKPAGSYEVEFNASNLSSGVYFYKLQSGSFVETRKMILLK
jgi:hypothetical protein